MTDPTGPFDPDQRPYYDPRGGFNTSPVHGYHGPQYGVPAPYGVHPMTGIPYSDKSKVTAGLLQLLLPFVLICGVGRLYSGHIGIGLTQLILYLFGWVLALIVIGWLIVPAVWLWSVIDGIVMLAGNPVDGHGRPLRP